jgi:hypothetical protein
MIKPWPLTGGKTLPRPAHYFSTTAIVIFVHPKNHRCSTTSQHLYWSCFCKLPYRPAQRLIQNNLSRYLRYQVQIRCLAGRKSLFHRSDIELISISSLINIGPNIPTASPVSRYFDVSGVGSRSKSSKRR